MLTEKDYCDYDTCVALKELGYDEYCCGYYHLTDEEDYNKNSFEMCNGFDFQSSRNRWRIGAPLLYQAQKWLREEKNVVVDVTFSPFEYFASVYVNVRKVESENLKRCFDFQWDEKKYAETGGETYEEALLEGIKEAIKIFEKENNDNRNKV